MMENQVIEIGQRILNILLSPSQLTNYIKYSDIALSSLHNKGSYCVSEWTLDPWIAHHCSGLGWLCGFCMWCLLNSRTMLNFTPTLEKLALETVTINCSLQITFLWYKDACGWWQNLPEKAKFNAF